MRVKVDFKNINIVCLEKKFYVGIIDSRLWVKV